MKFNPSQLRFDITIDNKANELQFAATKRSTVVHGRKYKTKFDVTSAQVVGGREVPHALFELRDDGPAGSSSVGKFGFRNVSVRFDAATLQAKRRQEAEEVHERLREKAGAVHDLTASIPDCAKERVALMEKVVRVAQDGLEGAHMRLFRAALDQGTIVLNITASAADSDNHEDTEQIILLVDLRTEAGESFLGRLVPDTSSM